MGEIVNLQRTRKAKARAEAAAQSDANRIKHGVAKKLRDLAKARSERAKQDVGAGKLDPKKP